MKSNASIDALVIGAGPSALSIAAALGNESLRVEVLSTNSPKTPWPYTYGIWGEEVDSLGVSNLLEHRWSNTVSYFGSGSEYRSNIENIPTNHNRDYGLFNKVKLQKYWLNQCDKASIHWNRGTAIKFEVNNKISTITTSEGKEIKARLIIDASGYKPIFLKSANEGPIAVQTCYGIVAEFNKPPIEKRQFVLMDYRCNHLTSQQREEPPSFLYAMDMGDGKFFLEETSLALSPPLSLEILRSRLKQRLDKRGIKIINIDSEELGLFLPMNIPVPDLNQPLLGFGGAAGMVHPASGYLVGSLLRRAPLVAKAVANIMRDKNATPKEIAKEGWKALWTVEMRRKQALYKFGIEKLMRFKEAQLRDFFTGFFNLPEKQWYGFLTNTLSLNELIAAMWKMYKQTPWKVKWALMRMQGRELKLLWEFIKPMKRK